MFILFFLFQLAVYSLLFRYFFLQISTDRIRYIFLSALLLKVIAAVVLGLLYKYYYQVGDTFSYFHDASLLSDIFSNDPSEYLQALINADSIQDLIFTDQPRALYFSKIVSLFALFSLDNYWIISISLSLVCFFVSWWFILKVIQVFEVNKYQLFISFLFFPSVVFWSSGLLKETLALSLIYLLCGITVAFYGGKLKSKKSIMYAFIFMLAGYFLWMLKYYYAAVILPLLVIVVVWKYLKSFSYFQKGRIWVGVISIFCLAITFWVFMHSHVNLKPDFILHAIVRNHNLSVDASDQGDYIIFESLSPRLTDVLILFPKAVIAGLYRPMIGEGATLIQWLASIENLILLLISLFGIINAFIKNNISCHSLIMACLVYIILLSGLIALASPNFGSLSRYKIVYTPFCLFLSLISICSGPFLKKVSQSMKKI